MCVSTPWNECRGQGIACRVGPLLPPCKPWELNPGHQAWWQGLLPLEPSCYPSTKKILKKPSYCYPKQPHNLYYHQQRTVVSIFWCCFWARIIYSSGCPETWYVAEAGLELQICLPLPSGAMITPIPPPSLPLLYLSWGWAPFFYTTPWCPYHRSWFSIASSLLRTVGLFPTTCLSNRAPVSFPTLWISGEHTSG